MLISSVAISPDSKRIVSGSWDTMIRVWDLESGRELRTLVGHSQNIRSVAISPDNKLIVSGFNDKTIKVWDLESGRELRTLVGHREHITSVAISPDSARALYISSDQPN